jgi:peroxiredoxin
MGSQGSRDRVTDRLDDSARAESPHPGQTVELPENSPLRHLSDSKPTLVVLLRSFGCTFCREAMSDVAAVKPSIDKHGAHVAFVHGATADEAAPWFAKYGLDDVTKVSDPTLAIYKAFGLGRTSATALVDPVVWARGTVCAIAHGFGGQTAELMRQLPGVFVIHKGRIVAAYRHRSPADRPNYLAILRSTETPVQ